MLEPRGADVPALFLFLVVLPLVTYFLLGKWSEASRRKERIGLLAHLVAEESLVGEVMVASTSVTPPPFVVSPPKVAVNVSLPPFLSAPKLAVASPGQSPFVSPSKVAFHECARCHAPATTRCSRCKSVRYCSGKCQIIHWRNIHKDECQPIEIVSSSHQHASTGEPADDKSFISEGLYGQSVDNPFQHPFEENTSSTINECASADHGAPLDCASRLMDLSNLPKQGRKSIEKTSSHITPREVFGMKERSTPCTPNDLIGNRASSKEMKKKLKGNDPVNPEDDFRWRLGDFKKSPGLGTSSREQVNAGCEDELGSNYRPSDACHHVPPGSYVNKVAARRSVDSGIYCKEGVVNNGDVPHRKSFSDVLPNGGSSRRSAHHSEAVKFSKSTKLMAISLNEHIHNTTLMNQHVLQEPDCKMTTLKKSAKPSRKGAPDNVDLHKKFKMLFPYEEFEKFFGYENIDLIPRGLSNCGNSCYANAVLQCLTCTKPLVVYLLKRNHSRTCRVKSWCLMCELEQYVQMLRESGGPLSPRRILSHVRTMNCRLGDGSQEDAHEFLRLLVASMQSICLEEYGGEKRVHSQLQETTFVQHAFGGRLRSRVKCLNCHHQSERCENIMDLTLEIYGWVESLEDALTQFTSPEDLEGENMYECGRCASYVRARKQLSIDEAPNILTIVLKRFQEGSYGKINKCITFPEMLDMVPFMTGTDDVPPLYLLYGVVVHMDTLNASFSGHYVSYVKDLQGNWLRIDDSEVQPVPVSQVMSEGAYILFYMRSYPRPSRAIVHKNHSSAKTHKSSRCSAGLSSDPFPSSAVKSSRTSHDMGQNVNNRRFSTPSKLTETYPGRSIAMEFPDAASSSDWSLFTSSDEATSTTTESTRDSCSTNADYTDVIPEHMRSLFSSLYSQEHAAAAVASSHRTVSCRMFSGSRSVTRFVPEEVNGYVVDSGDCDPSDDSVWMSGSPMQTTDMIGGSPVQMTDMMGGQYGTDNPWDFVTYGVQYDYPSMYDDMRTDHTLTD